VAFSWDPQGATLHVNGQSDRRKYKKSAPGAFDSDTFHLGGPYFQENDALTLISDLTIYGRALTDEEIQILYSASAEKGSGPVGRPAVSPDGASFTWKRP
jgi:hypothetical protein